MNGEMYQICRITAAAKKALKTGSAISYAPVKYENSIEFQFLPEKKVFGTKSRKAENVSSWYKHCVKKGLTDIKVIFPICVKDRNVLGFINTSQSNVVCFWNGKVTYFSPKWEFDSKNASWNILYTEYAGNNAPLGKPCFENNREEFEESLTRITKLARKIGCDDFASIFQKALDILLGSADYTDVLHKLPLPEITEEHLHLFEAASTADVFGAMGSWNDCPPNMANEMGLGDEYESLSGALLTQSRKAVLYAINEW